MWIFILGPISVDFVDPFAVDVDTSHRFSPLEHATSGAFLLLDGGALRDSQVDDK